MLHKQIKLNAYFAILFGIAIVCGETYRRFGDFGHWSRWMDDYIIGILLIVPAIMVLRGRLKGIKILIAGWGFACGLLYGSFFSKFLDIGNIRQSNIEPGLLVQLIGLGFFISILGLVWTVVLDISHAKTVREI